MEVDHGHAALTKVVDNYAQLRLSDGNEAETRKKVIDQIIEEVLGWIPVQDISYEETVRGDTRDTFADYSIRTAVTGFVVEAKRAGQSFELPSNRKAALLGGFLSEGEVGVAIKQARNYAIGLSLQFAVVTNGSAWIVFPAVRTDGVKWEDSEAHIFRSLADIRERFVEFWELLSRQRVIEGNLESTFFGQRNDLGHRRLLSVVHEAGFRLGRNSIYEYIEPAIGAAFTDEALLDDTEGLRYCYVKSSERVKYDSRLKIHLADAKPSLERKVARPRHSAGSAVLDETVSKSVQRPPQFLLVLGTVGAGKTTFLHYTRQVSSKAVIDGKIVWLYIDFKKATQADKPRQFIFREILKAIEEDQDFLLGGWKETISPAYQPVIEQLRRGPLQPLFASDNAEFEKEIAKLVMQDRNAVEPFVERILQWAAKARPVFLVVDNVDQFESEEFQRQIFIEAQAAARRMGLNIIMSLRDVTYLKHRNTPSFDAFQVDSLYIDPPQAQPVLARRFAYAKKFLEGKSAEIVTEKGVRYKVQNLAAFLESVSASLLSEKNGYMLEVLSGGDIRRALALVREFLASGHTSSDRVLIKYAADHSAGAGQLVDKRFDFPSHEIFKGCILGQRKFYREEDSLLPNIFDSKLGSPGKQLLRLHLLHKLVGIASVSAGEGYAAEGLKAELYQIGVPDGDIALLLKSLLDFRAIRTDDGRSLTEKSKLLPTRLGAYLLRELAKDFAYVEPCSLDTTIFLDPFWGSLRELTGHVEAASGERQVKLRIERLRKFVDYLIAIEQKWVVNCRRYQIGNGWDELVVASQLVPGLQESLARVERSVAKSAQRARASRDT